MKFGGPIRAHRFATPLSNLRLYVSYHSGWVQRRVPSFLQVLWCSTHLLRNLNHDSQQRSSMDIIPVAEALFELRYLTGPCPLAIRCQMSHCMRVTAVGLSWFAWDFVLTVGDEMRYIWKRSRLDASSMYFFWIRYSTAAGLAYSAYCT